MPGIRPIKDSLGGAHGPDLPKASTFYVGVSQSSGLHVFINFQHSPKAWEVGQFTINIVLSKSEGTPELWTTGKPLHVLEGKSPAQMKKFIEEFRAEGDYRIHQLLGGKDKWWHLKRDAEPIGTLAWRPTNYDNSEVVLSEAVADVMLDLSVVFDKLNIASPLAASDSK